MMCPECLTSGEVVYSALSRELICLASQCGWSRELDESEAFDLLFPGASSRRESLRYAKASESETEPSNLTGNDQIVA
jgi:hypothetical protein